MAICCRILGLMPKLIANILSHNELIYIQNLIPQVAQFVDKIIVVDDESADGTVEFLSRWPMVKIVHRKFDLNFSNQRNAAVDLVDEGDWIFRIDADEVLSKALVNNLHSTVMQLDSAGVDRCMIPIYHMVTYGLCKQEAGLEIRLFKKVPGLQYQKQFHEQVTASFPGGMIKFPSWMGLIHFKYMDMNRIKYTREFFIKNGLYDPKDLERRIQEDYGFLPPFVEFEINQELDSYLCSNRFLKEKE